MANQALVSESDTTVANDDGGSAAKPDSTLLRGIICALVAGAAACVAVQVIGAIGEVFVLPPDLASVGFGQVPSPEVKAKINAAAFSNSVRNAAIWLASAGAILGGSLAVVLSFSRQRGVDRLRLIVALVVTGTLFAALAGVAGAWSDSVARRNMPADASSPAEHFVLMIHGLVWLLVGAGIGAGVVIGSRGSNRSSVETMVTIALAGLLGGCLFPIVAGVLFPSIDSSTSIPGVDPSEGRILWMCLPSMFIGCAVGRRG